MSDLSIGEQRARAGLSSTGTHYIHPSARRRPLDVVEASLPPGPLLPPRPEVRAEHAPAVKAQGRLLMMIAAAYGWRNSPKGGGQ